MNSEKRSQRSTSGETQHWAHNLCGQPSVGCGSPHFPEEVKVTRAQRSRRVPQAWNNGKSGAKLDLTSLTTTGLQIHKFDHTWTANPCDWLPCRRAALLLVGYPHSLVYLHLPVVEGLIFCISATPHLGTSFPLFHDLMCPGAG